MSELSNLKKQIDTVITGCSSEFTIIDHQHVEDDIWSITVQSELTNSVFSFKNDGFSSYDFKQIRAA